MSNNSFSKHKALGWPQKAIAFTVLYFLCYFPLLYYRGPCSEFDMHMKGQDTVQYVGRQGRSLTNNIPLAYNK